MISLKTLSMMSSGSPSSREWKEWSYRLSVLSWLLALSYNALLTDGSVTLSSFPCRISSGRDTCSWNKFAVLRKRKEKNPYCNETTLF